MHKLKLFLHNSSIQYTFMAIFASGVNFLTLIIWGRIFSVEDYGAATTLQAVISNIAIFVTPLQIMLCKTTAMYSAGKTTNKDDMINIMAFIHIVELTCMLIAMGALKNYLHLAGYFDFFLFVCLTVSNNIYTMINGIVQGKQDFLLLGQTNILLYSLKMILSVLFGVCGLGISAVMIGFIIAEIVCVGCIIKKIWDVLTYHTDQFQFHISKNIAKEYIWMLILYLIVSLYMNNGDLLLGNLYCGREKIGLYSVAINLSKISIFLIATPVATVLLPKVAAIKNNSVTQRKFLIVAEAVTFGVSVLYGIGFCLFGPRVICLLYGEAYDGASAYLVPCMFFSVMLGIFWVFYQYAMAVDLMRAFAVVTAVIGMVLVVWILTAQPEIEVIPAAMTAAMGITIVIVLFWQICSDKYLQKRNE